MKASIEKDQLQLPIAEAKYSPTMAEQWGGLDESIRFFFSVQAFVFVCLLGLSLWVFGLGLGSWLNVYPTLFVPFINLKPER